MPSSASGRSLASMFARALAASVIFPSSLPCWNSRRTIAGRSSVDEGRLLRAVKGEDVQKRAF